jgi:hypothetical protein
VKKEMAHELTTLVYAHESVATLLDTLAAHKEACKENEIASAKLLQISRTHSVTTLLYNKVAVDD